MTRERLLTPRLVLQVLLAVVALPLLPLLVSGDWRWWQAWANAAVSIGGFALSRGLVARSHPDLLAERAHSLQKQDAKPWDGPLLLTMTLAAALALAVAGVERRVATAPALGWPLHALALAGIVGGYTLGAWAMLANRFFSGTVRIQADRGQRVISSGPYAWVRHPGYAGALLTYLLTPLLLASPWALAPTALAIAALLVRTAREDATLQAELPGYADYATHVRYRLLPGAW